MANEREGVLRAAEHRSRFARSQSGHFHAQCSASLVSLHRFISAPALSPRDATHEHTGVTVRADRGMQPSRRQQPSMRLDDVFAHSVRIRIGHENASL